MARLSAESHQLPGGETITLRWARQEDAQAVLDFLRSAAATTDQIASQPDEFPATAEEESGVLRQREESQAALFLLALHGDEIICASSLQPPPKRRLAHAARFGMTVGEAWRGKGVGTVLLRRLIDWAARESPLEKIYLEVFDTNAAGLALYRNLGFIEEGRQAGQTRFADGRYADQILMGLWVKAQPATARREFSLTRRVQFAETDMAGVMHFSNYFRLMEEVEHAFWRSLNLSVHLDSGDPERQAELLRNAGVAESFSWPRVAVSCEYSAAARFEDMLELRFRITNVGQRSLDQEVEFRRDGKRIALGKMKVVCCVTGAKGFRSIPIPPAVLEKLGT